MTYSDKTEEAMIDTLIDEAENSPNDKKSIQSAPTITLDSFLISSTNEERGYNTDISNAIIRMIII
jgi:glycerol kinase